MLIYLKKFLLFWSLLKNVENKVARFVKNGVLYKNVKNNLLEMLRFQNFHNQIASIEDSF